MWILSLYCIKISWQKSNYKKSKNCIESVERPIDFILFSNYMFFPPSKKFNCSGTSPLSISKKIFVNCGIGNSFIFSSILSSIIFVLSSTSGKSFENWVDKWRDNLSSSSFFIFWHHFYYIICLVDSICYWSIKIFL